MSQEEDLPKKDDERQDSQGRIDRLVDSGDSVFFRPPSPDDSLAEPTPPSVAQPLEEPLPPQNVPEQLKPSPPEISPTDKKPDGAVSPADNPGDITGGWFMGDNNPEPVHTPPPETGQKLSAPENLGAAIPPTVPQKGISESSQLPPFIAKRSAAAKKTSPEVTPPSGSRVNKLSPTPGGSTQDTPPSGSRITPPNSTNSGANRATPRKSNAETVSLPVVDRDGMPLPRRVSEIDPYATRVTPSAYQHGAQSPGQTTPRQGNRAAASGVTPVNKANKKSSLKQTQPVKTAGVNWRSGLGCLLRGIIALAFMAVLVVIVAGSLVIYQYYSIAATLPDVGGLRQKASQFETTRILDRNGNTLYEIVDPSAGKRTYEPLAKISPYLIAATIATEDKDFYSHPGFDPTAILRALWQNYTTGGTASGASTITQQLARALLLSPEERSQKTIERKAREIILAAEITRRYSKDDILELYINEIYYGNLAYGIEAATETYFNTTADKLDLAQAAFLAGLLQSPSVYDIYTKRDQTLQRQKTVLVLMYNDSLEQNCIMVNNAVQPVCVDAAAATQAASEMDAYTFTQSRDIIRYPHWVNYIRSLLEVQYDPQTIYRSGFTVYTTLDPGLEDQAEQIVKKQVDTLANLKVTNGALVAIKPLTGEILAMVGSADYYNEAISGQVNMATSSTRQPGSSIKPLTYVLAFERGWNPATLVWDVPSDFPPSGDPNDPRPPYQPVNYDGQFLGPLSIRLALANSRNIPAVKALQFVGIYDNPKTPGVEGLVSFAHRMGITSFTRNDYGLSLTLGGGEVSLMEMTGLYTIFANGGRRVPPVAITKIVDHSGNVLFNYTPPPGEQVIRPEHAFLITSILSDPDARTISFGAHSVVNLPFPAAVKTGTTNDFRDNWTIGYTPDITVGVLVCNANYTPMQNTTGLTGAAPIWAQFMQIAIQQLMGGNPTPFAKPAGVVERVICSSSGTEPSQWCPDQRSEFFASDQLPPTADNDLWQKALIDTWTGYRASPDCSGFSDEKFAANVSDPWAQKWIKDTKAGKAWADKMHFSQPIFFAPQRDCKASDPL